MASCFELDLGTLAFQESVTECVLGLTCDGAPPAEELGEGDAQGGASCADGAVVATPLVGACGSCSLTCAMPLIARERNAASNAPRTLSGFEQRFMKIVPSWAPVGPEAARGVKALQPDTRDGFTFINRLSHLKQRLAFITAMI